MRIPAFALPLFCAVLAGAASAQAGPEAKAVYQSSCAACHATGAAGAPKLGDARAWNPRLATGIDMLYRSAIAGKGAMPARGGNARLSDAAVESAVNYMVLQVDPKPAPAAGAKPPAGAVAVAPAAGKGTSPGSATEPAKSTAATPPVAPVVAGGKGASVYQSGCAACHATGIAGAPKVGDVAAWGARAKGGTAALYASALKGKGGMPAKGGNATLADADVQAAVDHMLAQSGVARPTGASAPADTPKSAATAPAGSTMIAAAVPPANVPSVPTPATAPAPTAPPSPVATAGDANAFNRLLRPPAQRNLPPAEDGIHDPGNDGTLALQPPLAAFAALPKSNAGNRIDWVKALTEAKIQPRFDRADPNAVPAVMDLNIVREVKGSMPDVVYPHKQHTEWLDCANCHPAIFVPQKGANQISMAAILLGQKCGVCHGKVAFPVSECRLCHSKNKATPSTTAVAK